MALSGCTGGIGAELCRLILRDAGSIIMLDRNKEKSEALEAELKRKFYTAQISRVIIDMEDICSVKSACEELKKYKIDVLIHNAGAYKIPRKICNTGYDNVFTINFISPYYITKQLLDKVKKVVVVGSIAHNYSKTDPEDVDFRTRKSASLVYGNAKRYLMYSHFELFKNHPEVKLAVTHPGITLTGITAHYPKWIYSIIKPLMKVIFMKPYEAAKIVREGLFGETKPYSWHGPRLFNIWGKHSMKKLKTAKADEIRRIYETAEKVYEEICVL